MTVFKCIMLIVPVLELWGQTEQAVPVQVQAHMGRRVRDGHVTTVFLAPRYVTAIKLPEQVNSVVLGDPSSFSVEHSDREPNLIFVKPITSKPAETNLLISSTRGLVGCPTDTYSTVGASL